MGIRRGADVGNTSSSAMSEEARSLCQHLQENGVIVRADDGTRGARRTAFRVSIGTPEQNEQFLGALKRARIPELK